MVIMTNAVLPEATTSTWESQPVEQSWRPYFLDGILVALQSILTHDQLSTGFNDDTSDTNSYKRTLILEDANSIKWTIVGEIDGRWQVTLNVTGTAGTSTNVRSGSTLEIGRIDLILKSYVAPVPLASP